MPLIYNITILKCVEKLDVIEKHIKTITSRFVKMSSATLRGNKQKTNLTVADIVIERIN